MKKQLFGLYVVYTFCSHATEEDRSTFERLRLQPADRYVPASSCVSAHSSSSGSSSSMRSSSPSSISLQQRAPYFASAGTIKQSQHIAKKSIIRQKDYDDTFELCSSMLPNVAQRLVAEYCIGSLKNICSTLIKALAWRRTILYCGMEDYEHLHMSLCDDYPDLMMLVQYGRTQNPTFPVINSFNFKTREHILRDYDSLAMFSSADDADVRRNAAFPYDGYFIPYTIRINAARGGFIFTKYPQELVPTYRALPVEVHEVARLGNSLTASGKAQRWHSSMTIAKLFQAADGSYWLQYIFVPKKSPQQIHFNPEEEPLVMAPIDQQVLIFSDDLRRMGLVQPRRIILFDGDTGLELMRCKPPKNFSFIGRLSVENEGLYYKIHAIPAHNGGIEFCYELIAIASKSEGLSAERSYLRWDIDKTVLMQNTSINNDESFTTIGGGRILSSGQWIGFIRKSYGGALHICDRVTDNGRSRLLWNTGQVDLFKTLNGACMYATRTGSHVILYGQAGNQAGLNQKRHDLYAFNVTRIHFDPTILYESDVLGVTDGSLIQRVWLLNALCTVACYDSAVTLHPTYCALFKLLHSDVRRNLQTTISEIHGWDEELAARESRIPILPPLKRIEKKVLAF